jgi:hypothetical protein
MTDATFFDAKLEKVYWLIKKSPYRAGGQFLKAPFDRLMLEGIPYIMPVSCYARGGTGGTGLSGIFSFDEGDEFSLGQQFLYDSLENIVMGSHEMGDWKGNKDNWLQVHKFGLI